MTVELRKIDVSAGRVGGVLYRSETNSKPLLVLFNQWRSSSHSLLSKYIAELVLRRGAYSAILFIDRIASGGASDDRLSASEQVAMREQGEFQFGKVYAEAIERILAEQHLPHKYVLGGSSAGAPAVVATAQRMNERQRRQVLALVLVEPSGMIRHGFGRRRRGALAQALAKHVFAYRHRLRRGWWSPMDKEQYFGRKGALLELRGNWWAGDTVYQVLCKALADPDFPPLRLVLSKTSHVHSASIRAALKQCVATPHRIQEVSGNHDAICQPPSLSKIYSNAVE